MLSIAFGLAMTVASSAPAPVAAAAAKEPCCFTNPRFTGVCKVTPDEDTTCADVLNYLNNPNSVGRAYCGNTKVRGGWKQVPCDENQAAMCPVGDEGSAENSSDAHP